MAHTKSGGSTQLGRDSNPKYLGVKLYDGEPAKPGSILVRQRGTHFRAGQNVKQGGDDTLYATAKGKVKFSTKRIKKFNGRVKLAKFVSVIK
jgi:large subunit ribosomal protein L27